VETHAIQIAGMTCEHCAKRVEKALLGRTGVKSARVDLAAKCARVTLDPVQATLPDLHQAILKSGYQPVQ
jgi:copper chaperone CopZ